MASIINSELSRYLITAKAHDRATVQLYIVAHSLIEANQIAAEDPNVKELLKVEKVEETQRKPVKARSGFVSNCLSDDINNQLTATLNRLHKGGLLNE